MFVMDERKRRARRKRLLDTYDAYPPTAKGYLPLPPDSYGIAGTTDCRKLVVGHDWWEGPAREQYQLLRSQGVHDTQQLVAGILRALAPVCYTALENPSAALSSFSFDLANAVDAWKGSQTGIALSPRN